MNMIRKAILFASILLLWAGPGEAGVINGSVTAVSSGVYGAAPYLIVFTSNTVTAQPACGTAGGLRAMIIFVDSEAGREMSSIAKAAYFTGATVTIAGTGTCTVHPSFETAVVVESP